MNNKLLTQLKILRLMGIKPNFSELARIYDTDREPLKSIMTDMKESRSIVKSFADWIYIRNL